MHFITCRFSEAFNSISFKMFLSTMKLCNFPNKFINWIKTFLSNYFFMTLVNGYLSLKMLLEHGCCQGDPIAGYLCILAIEILLLHITNHLENYPRKSTKENQHLADGYIDILTYLISTEVAK